MLLGCDPRRKERVADPSREVLLRVRLPLRLADFSGRRCDVTFTVEPRRSVA
jgi:hypothetical protein